MRSLDTHLSQITRSNQVKTQFARFYKLDIAVAAVTGRARTSYLLLSGHYSGVVAWASRARLTMLNIAHRALRIRAWNLWHHLVLTYCFAKCDVSIYADDSARKKSTSFLLTLELIPQVADVQALAAMI